MILTSYYRNDTVININSLFECKYSTLSLLVLKTMSTPDSQRAFLFLHLSTKMDSKASDASFTDAQGNTSPSKVGLPDTESSKANLNELDMRAKKRRTEKLTPVAIKKLDDVTADMKKHDKQGDETEKLRDEAIENAIQSMEGLSELEGEIYKRYFRSNYVSKSDKINNLQKQQLTNDSLLKKKDEQIRELKNENKRLHDELLNAKAKSSNEAKDATIWDLKLSHESTDATIGDLQNPLRDIAQSRDDEVKRHHDELLNAKGKSSNEAKDATIRELEEQLRVDQARFNKLTNTQNELEIVQSRDHEIKRPQDELLNGKAKSSNKTKDATIEVGTEILLDVLDTGAEDLINGGDVNGHAEPSEEGTDFSLDVLDTGAEDLINGCDVNGHAESFDLTRDFVFSVRFGSDNIDNLTIFEIPFVNGHAESFQGLQFSKIVTHTGGFKNDLEFSAFFGNGKIFEIPFEKMKDIDETACADYIVDNVVERTRNGPYAQWAKEVHLKKK